MRKTLVTAIVCVVMLLAFVGCGGPSLQEYTDKLNEEFPKEYAEGWVVKSAGIENDYFVLESEVDESNSEFALFLIDEINDMASKEFKDMVLTDENMKKVLDLCKKENKGMKMTMMGKQSGKTVTLFNVTPEEMQKQ